jgi:hypothetical protein
VRVVQCGVQQGPACGAERVWCRANVVQASVVQCGAGRMWCKATVMQGMVHNKVQGVVCMASVVQGGVQADGVQWVWCRKMWCSLAVLEGGACDVVRGQR